MASYNNFPNINLTGDLQANGVSGTDGQVFAKNSGVMAWRSEFNNRAPIGSYYLSSGAKAQGYLNIDNAEVEHAGLVRVGSTITVQEAGVYKIDSIITMVCSLTNSRLANEIHINNSGYFISIASPTTANGQTAVCPATGILRLNALDTIRFWFQDMNATGGTFTIPNTGAAQLGIIKLSD